MFHADGGGSTKSISTPILIGATCVGDSHDVPLERQRRKLYTYHVAATARGKDDG